MEYDGSGFSGFQWQANVPSVQATLERAIEAATGNASRVSAAGRTDSGAHAAGQVVSFAVDSPLTDLDLLNAVNARLPGHVALQSLETTDEAFDPRRWASKREYHYLVLNRRSPSPLWRGRAHQVRSPLDVASMRAGAAHLVGVHDYSAFGTPSTKDGVAIRKILVFDVEDEGEIIRFRIVGTGFMQHMIRTMIGTLLRVGRGKNVSEDIQTILLSRDRKRAATAAPACGLYLMHVTYDKERADS